MKLRVLLISLIALFAVLMQAQTAAEVEETVKRIEASSSKCNMGPEAFKTFIAKFSTNETFFNSRISLTDEQKETYKDILLPENMKAKEPFAKDDEMYYQSWGEGQYSKVYLECGWVDSYVTHIFEFSRAKAGKWYLTNIIVDE